MQKIKRVIFTLENCEIIDVDSEHILSLGLEDIVNSLRMTSDKDMIPITICKEIEIVLKGTGDRENRPFGLDTTGNIYDRLTFNDITSIEIEYEGCSEKTSLYVDYEEVEGSYKNKNQKTHINKFNDIFIVIVKNKELSDCFDTEALEEIDYMNYHYYYNYIG